MTKTSEFPINVLEIKFLFETAKTFWTWFRRWSLLGKSLICSNPKSYVIPIMKLDWSKVQLFWECHTNYRNLPHGIDIYLVNVKTMRAIAQIFVALSEKLNFNKRGKLLNLTFSLRIKTWDRKSFQVVKFQ